MLECGQDKALCLASGIPLDAHGDDDRAAGRAGPHAGCKVGSKADFAHSVMTTDVLTLLEQVEVRAAVVGSHCDVIVVVVVVVVDVVDVVVKYGCKRLPTSQQLGRHLCPVFYESDGQFPALLIIHTPSDHLQVKHS